MSNSNGEITIRDANLPGGPWRNFTGREGKYNAEGDRSFTLFLDPNFGEQLRADGWNVKMRQPREDGDEIQAYLSVSVSYKMRPPTVVLVTRRGRRNMEEADLEFLDWMEFEKVDLIVRPYHWNVRGEAGVKAYLKALYVTMHEDELAIEYGRIQEIGATEQLAIEQNHDYIEGVLVDETEQLAIEGPRR